MATLRRDDAPRLSGTEVNFHDDGEVYLGIMAGAQRATDLRRDPRVAAIHSPTVDPPDEDPTSWLGDGKIAARAVEVQPPWFCLDIGQVVLLTKVAPSATELEINTWSPPTGMTVTRRS